MSRPRPAPRRRSRAAALQVLYAIDVLRRQGERAPAPQEVFESTAAHFELPAGARAFAETLVLGVCGHLPDLDARLARHSAHWRPERMATVDRNILRLGLYELAYSDVPTAVAIDEAVELARRFGADDSPKFVNGILDAAARACRGQAA